MSVDVKYTTQACATGGRDGQSATLDGSLQLTLATPNAFGGPVVKATILNSAQQHRCKTVDILHCG